MLAMHQNGAYTVAQDESSCVVFGMPHRAILAGGVSTSIPLSEISKEICEHIFPQAPIEDLEVLKT
jgi:two-component system chemotaxis response regulator CheB